MASKNIITIKNGAEVRCNIGYEEASQERKI